MATGGRIASVLRAALLAATAILLPVAPAPANPACNIGDILNAAGNSVGALTSNACDATYATGAVGISAGGTIAFGLGALAASGNGGRVSSVCNDLNTVTDDISSIAS